MEDLADAQLIEAAVAYAKRVGPAQAARELEVDARTVRRWQTDPPNKLTGSSRAKLLDKLPSVRVDADTGYADGAQDVVDYVREALDRYEQAWLTPTPEANGDDAPDPQVSADTALPGDNDGKQVDGNS